MKGVKDYRCGRWPMTEPGDTEELWAVPPTLVLPALQSRPVTGASHKDLEGFALMFLPETGDKTVATFPRHSEPAALPAAMPGPPHCKRHPGGCRVCALRASSH